MSVFLKVGTLKKLCLLKEHAHVFKEWDAHPAQEYDRSKSESPPDRDAQEIYQSGELNHFCVTFGLQIMTSVFNLQIRTRKLPSIFAM